MHELWLAVILGLVEGLTEYLPVSSTGHLILVGEWLHFTGERAETFEIFIQLGAILAVMWLYRKRFWDLAVEEAARPGAVAPPRREWPHLGAPGCRLCPRLRLRGLLHGTIKAHLFSSRPVVVGLVAGGVLMIVAEMVAGRRA